MTRRFIDISAPLRNDVVSDPPGHNPKIEYIDHQQSLPQILPFFPGLKTEDLPDGQGWAIERVQLTTHNGTHLYAPWHYHPTMNEGERAWTIDEVPLEWCFQPGVKLDLRHFPDGYVATAADLDEELKRIGYALKPLDIVLVNTSAGAKYGRPDYVASGCGIGAEGTLHLLKQGVRVTGTDGWSWDAPFIHTAKRYGETHDASLILGGAQGQPPHWLLPYREIAQPRGAPTDRLHRLLLPNQDRGRLGRLDTRGGDHRRVNDP